MAEQIKEEIKEMYSKRRSALKEEVDSLRHEISSKMGLKRNESYKEVEFK